MKKIILVIDDIVTPTNDKLPAEDTKSDNKRRAFPPIKLSEEEANQCDQQVRTKVRSPQQPNNPSSHLYILSMQCDNSVVRMGGHLKLKSFRVDSTEEFEGI
jgi:hypothetical protein